MIKLNLIQQFIIITTEHFRQLHFLLSILMQNMQKSSQRSISEKNSSQTVMYRSMYQSSDSQKCSQKKLIIDLRSELCNLKTEFTKLITKPAQTKNEYKYQTLVKYPYYHKDVANLSEDSKQKERNKSQYNHQQSSQNFNNDKMSIFQSDSECSQNFFRNQKAQSKYVKIPLTGIDKFTNQKHTKGEQEDCSDTKSNTNSCSQFSSSSVFSNPRVSFSKNRSYINYRNGPSKPVTIVKDQQQWDLNEEKGKNIFQKPKKMDNNQEINKHSNFQKEKQCKVYYCNVNATRNRTQQSVTNNSHLSKLKNPHEKENNQEEFDYQTYDQSFFPGGSASAITKQSISCSVNHERKILLETLQKLEKDKNQIQSNYVLMKDQLCRKQNQCGLKVSTICQLEKIIQNIQKDNNLLEQQCSKLQKQLAKRSGDQGWNKLQEQKEKAVKDHKISEIRLKQEAERNNLLGKQLRRLNTQIKNMGQNLKQMKDTIQVLEKDKNALQQENSKLKNDEKKKIEWISSLSKKMRGIQAEKLQQKQTDQNTIKILEKNNKDYHLENQYLKQQLQIKKDQMSSLAKKISHMQSQISDKNQKLVFLDKIQKSLEESKIQCKKKQQWVSSLAKKVNQLQNMIKNNASSQPLQDSNGLKTKNQNSQAKLQQYLAKTIKLEEKIMSLQGQKNYLTDKIYRLERSKLRSPDKKEKSNYQKSGAKKQRKSSSINFLNKQIEPQTVINTLMCDINVLQRQMESVQKNNQKISELISEENDQIVKLRVQILNQKYSRYL